MSANHSCPSCGVPVPDSAVVSVLRAARCPGCGALVDLEGRGVVRFEAPERSALLAEPEGLVIDETAGRFSARWRWFTWGTLLLVPFAAFWNGVLLIMGLGLTEGGQHPERLLYGLAVPHVWVGVGLLYWVVASFFNSTEVSVEGGELVVRHGPVPWLGGQRLAVSELQQLFVVESPTRRGSQYQLCALLKDGKKRTLLKRLSSPERARFLEQRIEALLGVVDQRVSGEMRR